jgi:hypothetical protein
MSNLSLARLRKATRFQPYDDLYTAGLAHLVYTDHTDVIRCHLDDASGLICSRPWTGTLSGAASTAKCHQGKPYSVPYIVPHCATMSGIEICICRLHFQDIGVGDIDTRGKPLQPHILCPLEFFYIGWLLQGGKA